jgi:predicted HicB family RNase H-like nuclease
MIRFQITVEEKMHDKLRQEAHDKRVSIARLVRDALDEKYPEAKEEDTK